MLTLLHEASFFIFHDQAIKGVICYILASVQIQLLQREGIAILIYDDKCVLIDVLAILE